MKKYILGAVSFLFVMSLLMISGEIVLRAYHSIKYSKNQSSGKSIVLDDELGWLPASNYAFTGDKVDASGKKYSVKISTNKDGFRIFGNTQEQNKIKVLFLGDSFTNAVDVSNSKTYYGILKDTLPVEVFAFGGGGYGTLQEYMILEKYVDEIRPDILVLQFCSNDFINNDYDLELRSRRNNNGMRRPYLTESGIVYRLPKNFPVIRDLVNKYSQFLYFIISRIDRIQSVRADSVEDIIQEKGVEYPFFRESAMLTEQLIKKIKTRVPSSTKIYAFSVDDSQPYYDAFKRIAAKNGIDFIDGVPQAVSGAEQKGLTTRAADKAHWNETGHRIAAKVLGNYFEATW